MALAPISNDILIVTCDADVFFKYKFPNSAHIRRIIFNSIIVQHMENRSQLNNINKSKYLVYTLSYSSLSQSILTTFTQLKYLNIHLYRRSKWKEHKKLCSIKQ